MLMQIQWYTNKGIFSCTLNCSFSITPNYTKHKWHSNTDFTRCWSLYRHKLPSVSVEAVSSSV